VWFPCIRAALTTPRHFTRYYSTVVASAIRSAPASSSSNLHGRVRQGLRSSSSRVRRRRQRRHGERRRRARGARRWHARDARRNRSAADARRRLPPRRRHPRLATHMHRRRHHRILSTRSRTVARHLRLFRHLAPGLGGQRGRLTILSRRSARRVRRSTGRAKKWANRSAARPMPSAQPFATWGSSWRALAALRAEHDTHQQLALIDTEREVSSLSCSFFSFVRTRTTHRSTG
jgi:hypothetical protein